MVIAQSFLAWSFRSYTMHLFGSFVWIKLNSDPLVIGVAIVTIVVIAAAEQVYLKSSARRKTIENDARAHHH